MKRWINLLFLAGIVIVLTACGGGTNQQEQAPADEGSSDQQEMTSEEDTNNTEESTEGTTENTDGATANEEVNVSLQDADGNVTANATLTEEQAGEGVNIALEGENLPPGTHGFHIHNTGSCEPPAFDSAGDHYNPTDANHGFEDPEGPHAGDLENIEVSEDGTVNTEVTADMVTLEQGAETTLYPESGTSLVIHSEADDYVSQPSGDAGDRIACGVIGEQNAA